MFCGRNIGQKVRCSANKYHNLCPQYQTCKSMVFQVSSIWIPTVHFSSFRKTKGQTDRRRCILFCNRKCSLSVFLIRSTKPLIWKTYFQNVFILSPLPLPSWEQKDSKELMLSWVQNKLKFLNNNQIYKKPSEKPNLINWHANNLWLKMSTNYQL